MFSDSNVEIGSVKCHKPNYEEVIARLQKDKIATEGLINAFNEYVNIHSMPATGNEMGRSILAMYGYLNFQVVKISKSIESAVKEQEKQGE